MSEELKPCPFCGGEAKKEYAGGDCWIACTACEMVGAIYPSEDEAVAAWNRRAEPKAAPLVWEEGDDEFPKAFISHNPNVFYTCYETLGVGFRAVFFCGGESDSWDECGFKDEASAKAACQAHADGLVKQLLTGNKQ